MSHQIAQGKSHSPLLVTRGLFIIMPFAMGYEAMMMAINVLQGGEASDIVIPAVWFDASNMDDPEISRILYD